MRVVDQFSKIAKQTQIKSKCGDAACDCDNMAEMSSSGSSVPHVHHHHDEPK